MTSVEKCVLHVSSRAKLTFAIVTSYWAIVDLPSSFAKWDLPANTHHCTFDSVVRTPSGYSVVTGYLLHTLEER